MIECPIMCNTSEMFCVWYSCIAKSMMLPPLPSAKSYHTFLVKSTLNDAVFSVCSGDKYHHLFPFLFIGSYPLLARKLDIWIAFISCIVIM